MKRYKRYFSESYFKIDPELWKEAKDAFEKCLISYLCSHLYYNYDSKQREEFHITEFISEMENKYNSFFVKNIYRDDITEFFRISNEIDKRTQKLLRVSVPSKENYVCMITIVENRGQGFAGNFQSSSAGLPLITIVIPEYILQNQTELLGNVYDYTGFTYVSRLIKNLLPTFEHELIHFIQSVYLDFYEKIDKDLDYYLKHKEFDALVVSEVKTYVHTYNNPTVKGFISNYANRVSEFFKELKYKDINKYKSALKKSIMLLNELGIK